MRIFLIRAVDPECFRPPAACFLETAAQRQVKHEFVMLSVIIRVPLLGRLNLFCGSMRSLWNVHFKAIEFEREQNLTGQT